MALPDGAAAYRCSAADLFYAQQLIYSTRKKQLTGQIARGVRRT